MEGTKERLIKSQHLSLRGNPALLQPRQLHYLVLLVVGSEIHLLFWFGNSAAGHLIEGAMPSMDPHQPFMITKVT